MDDQNNKNGEDARVTTPTEAPKAGSQKTCSVCGSKKQFDEFYKKGKRYDSACKSCQKAKKKAHYSTQKNSDSGVAVQKMLELLKECFVNQITSEMEKLDKEIKCRLSKKR